ncbi:MULTISPECIES: 3-hydroxyacyl-CoA dehydrogenase family protein [unclassified Micromonospora]|uniref:3-hydroxyacyl-CoA dehydrogenase family protein n=1 Tax=unclassified Micromonospora TaxID=2617518 RepID=UPI001592075F|nr:3-hydroxyacyl-CoA dehydrogenase family protein [Verrucosispora sp. NA02020]QKW15152.1 3-hydroxyacyl-CoA dehydrogenase family protein [Verrucosispora sp. NA02020]
MATVGVIGAGVMGKDVAITCAAKGYDVILSDHDSDVLATAPRDIRQLVRKFRMMSPAAAAWKADEILGRIRFGTDLGDLAGVDWIVENIVEDLAAKERLYLDLRDVCGESTKIAVNTSCISITKLAAGTPRPHNVVGIHFMNPVPLLECAEVVRGYHTSEDTIKQAEEFVRSLGKQSIVVNDMPGFVSNRLSHLFMNEAAFLVHDGVAEPEQIDAIFKLGYGHRMGPLETADLIGLDTVVDSLNVLYAEFQDSKFRCCPTLKKMVAAGRLGRKSGQGFYTYANH